MLVSSLQVLEGHSEISSKPSHLQAKQSQLPQPVFIGEMHQSFGHLCGFPLDLFHQLLFMLSCSLYYVRWYDIWVLQTVNAVSAYVLA